MEIIKLQDTYTIVVVATIDTPFYVQASWMRDRNIINCDEWAKVHGVLVVPDASRFDIGESITFYCNKERLQIRTTDYTKIARVQSIADGIVASLDIPDDSFRAVGINNEFIFTFHSEDDSVRFGDTFVPLEKWKSMFNMPRVLEFSVKEAAFINKGEPCKTLKISSVGAQENSNIPIINANSNYHHEVACRQEVKKVLSKATKFFNEFNDTFSNFVKGVQ